MAGPSSTAEVARPATLGRRLAAMVYDSLLLLAVLLFATAPLLVLTGGEAISAYRTVYQAYLVLLSFAFFAWQWIRGGQTLGMRAWKIRVQGRDGGALSLGQALVRFAGALVSLGAFGLGFFWLLLDRDRLAWHDRWSNTVVVSTKTNR